MDSFQTGIRFVLLAFQTRINEIQYPSMNFKKEVQEATFSLIKNLRGEGVKSPATGLREYLENNRDKILSHNESSIRLDEVIKSIDLLISTVKLSHSTDNRTSSVAKKQLKFWGFLQ